LDLTCFLIVGIFEGAENRFEKGKKRKVTSNEFGWEEKELES
jgi:hypothetical protein